MGVAETALGATVLTGRELDDLAGEAVGRVEGALVDPASGDVEWIAVRTARFGGQTLVPARDAAVAGGRVWVPYATDAIRTAPKARSELTQDAELELLRHYGIAGPAGRAAEIAGRRSGEVTARLA
jgi:sporulation protein YlmC with PRC-barrel domain